MSAYTDAQVQNDITRNVRQYKDLDLFFSKKATTKDINKVTDIQAVKRSIRNLVLLNYYEKPFPKRTCPKGSANCRLSKRRRAAAHPGERDLGSKGIQWPRGQFFGIREF